MSLHLLTFRLNVDDAELEAQRAIAESEGELDDFYGQPEEWSSIIQLVDAQAAGVILSSELLERGRARAHDPYKRPGRVSRAIAWALRR